MKTRWNYSELLNLEYYLERDGAVDDPLEREALRKRDRALFLERCGEDGEPEASSDACLHQWLAARLAQDAVHGPSPGQVIGEATRFGSLALAGAGALSGMLGASALLAYGGEQPVNVFVYLVVFVFFQLFFLLVLPLSWLARSLAGSGTSFPALASLSSTLAGPLLRRAILKAGTLGRSDRVQGLERLLGLLRGKNRVYGRLFWWPPLLAMQSFTLALHTGALLATLFVVTTRDIAFGWQSTLPLGAEAVHGLVRTMALPWSWFLGSGIGWPDLSQVEGSRIVLKDSIEALATTDLTAWWPFLCLALLCYALVPRLLLFFATRMLARKDLRRVRPDHALVRQLLQRMRTPELVTQGGNRQQERREIVSDQGAGQQEAVTADTPAAGARQGVTVLAPEPIRGNCAGPLYADFLYFLTGLAEQRQFAYDAGMAEDEALLAQLGQEDWSGKPGVVLLAEAWMPPISDSLEFIQGLRQALGDGVEIVIALLGKPEDTIFTAPTSRDVRIWSGKLQGLGDPWLRVEPYAVTAEEHGHGP